MRSHAFHSLVAVTFVALAACGGKTLPIGDDPSDAGNETDGGGIQTDGTCTTSAPDCGDDGCGNPLTRVCNDGVWSCVANPDDCEISPPPFEDGGVSVDDASIDTGTSPPPNDAGVDATNIPDASGIPCDDTTACPSDMFCQEQSDFTFQCADFPAACTGDHSCTCVLDNGIAACPQEFGWACETNSAGDVEWLCTAP